LSTSTATEGDPTPQTLRVRVDNDPMVPELSLSVIRPAVPRNLAEVGPISSYDFGPPLAQLLAEGDWGQPADRIVPTMVDCRGVFDGTGTSFTLNRLVLGQLVAFGLSIRLVFTRLAVGSGSKTDQSLDSQIMRGTSSRVTRRSPARPVLENHLTDQWRIEEGLAGHGVMEHELSDYGEHIKIDNYHIRIR